MLLGWLIDANVVSEMMRPFPEPRVAAYLDSVAGDGIGLTSVTAWEVFNGIGRLPMGRRRRGLAERLQALIDVLFEDRMVDWSLADARECARIMEYKRRLGEPLDDHLPDAFLAAAASTRGIGIVTRNTGDFRNTGVETVDPWAALPQ